MRARARVRFPGLLPQKIYVAIYLAATGPIVYRRGVGGGRGRSTLGKKGNAVEAEAIRLASRTRGERYILDRTEFISRENRKARRGDIKTSGIWMDNKILLLSYFQIAFISSLRRNFLFRALAYREMKYENRKPGTDKDLPTSYALILKCVRLINEY